MCCQFRKRTQTCKILANHQDLERAKRFFIIVVNELHGLLCRCLKLAWGGAMHRCVCCVCASLCRIVGRKRMMPNHIKTIAFGSRRTISIAGGHSKQSKKRPHHDYSSVPVPLPCLLLQNKQTRKTCTVPWMRQPNQSAQHHKQ